MAAARKPGPVKTPAARRRVPPARVTTSQTAASRTTARKHATRETAIVARKTRARPAATEPGTPVGPAKPVHERTSVKTARKKAAAKTSDHCPQAGIAARKATVAATMVRPKDETVIVDDGDTTGPVRVQTSGIRVRRTAVERVDDPPLEAGPALIARVTRAIERELLRIEVIVGGHHLKPQQRTEAERRARTLASLARTLGEVTRLRADQQKVKPADDDSVPRDLDEFRRTLSRRLEQLVGVAAPVPAGGTERGGA